MKFTEISIRNLKPKPGGKYYARAEMGISQKHGFAICVYPSGKKSWFFIYTFDGKRNSLCLGHYPEMGIADATKKYEEQWQIFASGKNPATVKQDSQQERKESPTIEDLGKDYLKRHAEVNKRSWKEDERILKVEVYPTWGERKAQDITKRDVLNLLHKVVDRGSPHTANTIFKNLRAMFNWAVENDRLNATPFVKIKLPTPATPKDRVLSEAEIKSFWNRLEAPYSPETDTGMTCYVKNALKLILITAQRPGEVSGMHTREIDGMWWTIPADRAKNKTAHRIPLTGLALRVIAETIQAIKQDRKIPMTTEYSGYIFPTPHRAKDEPIDRHALSKALKRKVDKGLLFGLPPFTPHDLRRTASTRLAEMGEKDEVIDAILNHTKQGIIKVYNQYRYDKEKQMALETWERKLNSIIIGAKGKVVTTTKEKPA